MHDEFCRTIDVVLVGERHDDGHGDQGEKDHRRHNRGLVLEEALHRVLEEGGRLGLELSVVDVAFALNIGEIRIEDLLVFDCVHVIHGVLGLFLFHYFLAPILMRGSTMP